MNFSVWLNKSKCKFFIICEIRAFYKNSRMLSLAVTDSRIVPCSYAPCDFCQLRIGIQVDEIICLSCGSCQSMRYLTSHTTTPRILSRKGCVNAVTGICYLITVFGLRFYRQTEIFSIFNKIKSRVTAETA